MPRNNDNEEIDLEEQEIQKPAKKNILIISLIVLTIISMIGMSVLGYIVYDNISNPTPTQKSEEIVEDYNEESNDNSYSNVGHIVQFDQMIINLSSSKGKKNYLKIQINIEFRDEDDLELYKERKALLFDSLLTAASSKSKDELMTIGGKEELKMELKDSFNDILGRKVVKNIYWKTFVIQ